MTPGSQYVVVGGFVWGLIVGLVVGLTAGPDYEAELAQARSEAADERDLRRVAMSELDAVWGMFHACESTEVRESK